MTNCDNRMNNDTMSHLVRFIFLKNPAKIRLLPELGVGNEKTPTFTPSNDFIMTLKEAQTAVDEWIKTYGVRYFSELTNMALLTEEVGELARIIARTYGEQSFKESDKNRNLADEMADILWVLLCLANQTGVDLTDAFAKNMEKKTSRDKERHIHNDKLRDPIA